MGLPSDYTRLEYIESTGTEYIDTGVKPTQNTRVITKIANAPATTEQQLFGSRSGTSSSDRFLFLAAGDTKKYRNDFYNNNINIDSAFNFPYTFIVDKNKENLYLNGKLAGTNTAGTFTGAYNMFIFAANTAGTANKCQAGTQFYYFKIYENNTLVKYFIPVKNSSDALGMYDLVNNQFHANLGTGSFIAGPSITNQQYIKINNIWIPIDTLTINLLN